MAGPGCCTCRVSVGGRLLSNRWHRMVMSGRTSTQAPWMRAACSIVSICECGHVSLHSPWAQARLHVCMSDPLCTGDAASMQEQYRALHTAEQCHMAEAALVR